MRSAKSYDECKSIQAEHHQLMEQRAKDQGKTLPAPRANACDRMKANGFFAQSGECDGAASFAAGCRSENELPKLINFRKTVKNTQQSKCCVPSAVKDLSVTFCRF